MILILAKAYILPENIPNAAMLLKYISEKLFGTAQMIIFFLSDRKTDSVVFLVNY